MAWKLNQLGPSIALVALAFVSLPVGSGCGTPCGNLWQKLDRCAKTDAHRKETKSKDMKRAFMAHCKKADKSRIKECIKLKTCDKMRQCVSKLRNKYK